jgi:alpha-D-ribose 1-methylphosphonate 5-triphosphate synthase subunit PhnH
VLARPGLTARLTAAPCEGGGAPAATIPAACLADVEVPLAVIGAAGLREPWAQALALVTGAPVAEPQDARMVLALSPLTADEVAALPRGDALHPELGCRLVQAVDGLYEARPSENGPYESGPSGGRRDGGAAAGGVTLRLRGPGVPGERFLTVAGPPPEFFGALAEANAAFPAGVDTFLVAPDGTVAGLPRSVQMTTATAGED